MKKQLLLIFLLFITLTGSAQNNWKSYSSATILQTTSNEDYTWLLYSHRTIKINNKTMGREIINYPNGLFGIRTCVSYKDELWISSEIFNSTIFHYKNGSWSSFKDPGTDYIMYSGINSANGTVVFSDPMTDRIIIIKNNTQRVISIPDNIETSSKICIPSANSIIYYSEKCSMIIELDTNGILKNKFSMGRIGTTGFYSKEMFVDKNQNLYAYFQNDGLFKIKLGFADTTFQKIIPQAKLSSLDWESFSIDMENKIVVKSSSFRYDTLYTFFNSDGSEIISYNVIKGLYGYNYSLAGFNSQGKPISLFKRNEVWKCDYFDWELIYNPMNQYEGDIVKYSTRGSNDKLFFGTETKIYELNNDSIFKLSFNNLYLPINLKYKSILLDNSGNLFISIVNNGKLEIAKRNTHSTIEFESQVPNTPLSADDLDGNEMLFNNDNKLCVLMNNSISVYSGSNNWISIPTKTSDNISELYSFCKDGNGDIWVGTNKGIAKVVNNQIELQSAINKKNKIKTIKYNVTNNCLVFANNIDFTGSACLYYFNTQNLVTLNTQYEVEKIVINNNNKAYFQNSSSEIWRYNISTNGWDTAFNNHISNTPFSNGHPTNFELDNNDRFYIFSTNNFTINEKTIYVYNENGFSFIENSIANALTLNLYPNPTSGLLTIDSKEKYSNYFVYNMLGEVLENGNIENSKIDLSELPSGVYTVKVVGEKGGSFRKVIKK